MVALPWMISPNPMELADSGAKQEATIPMTIPKELYGDTMSQPLED
jgi:hypothetical protein